MSSLMTGMIWKARGLQGVERLILLAIADEANSMGDCYLELQMLARKVDMDFELFMVQCTKLSSKNYVTVSTAANGDYTRLGISTLTAMAKSGSVPAPPPLESPKSATTGLKPLRSRVLLEGEKYRAKKEQKQTRPRNVIWDALVEAIGAPLTKSETSDFAKTVKELTEAGAKPEDLAGFKAWWDREYTGASCTHRCYRQHYGKYATVLEKRVSKSNELDL